jgi:hypothetical protein
MKPAVGRVTDERTPLRHGSMSPDDASGDHARRDPRPLWRRLNGGKDDLFSGCLLLCAFLLLVPVWGLLCYVVWNRAMAMYSTEWVEGKCTVVAVEDYAHSECYGYMDDKAPSEDEASGLVGRRALLASAQNRITTPKAAVDLGSALRTPAEAVTDAGDGGPSFRASGLDFADFNSYLVEHADTLIAASIRDPNLDHKAQPVVFRMSRTEVSDVNATEYGSGSHEPGGAAIYAAPEGRPKGAPSSCSDGVMNGGETGVDCASPEGRFGVRSRSAGGAWIYLVYEVYITAVRNHYRLSIVGSCSGTKSGRPCYFKIHVAARRARRARTANRTATRVPWTAAGRSARRVRPWSPPGSTPRFCRPCRGPHGVDHTAWTPKVKFTGLTLKWRQL